MKMTTNKSYLIRAIYDWIIDNNCTPYLLVNADYPGVQVPLVYVNDGQIILNISLQACRGLHLDNEKILFTACFSGKTEQIFLPPAAVLAIYANENGRGMEFAIEAEENLPLPPSGNDGNKKNKPFLTLVKNT